MSPRIILTDHACYRYLERYAPWLSLAEARDVLEEAARHALPMRERTPRGEELWAISEPLGRLVVKRDGGALWVVTVLCEEQTRTGASRGRRRARA